MRRYVSPVSKRPMARYARCMAMAVTLSKFKDGKGLEAARVWLGRALDCIWEDMGYV